jgi:uncharacterized membrane protein YphA (DoxX/SURF4 family)
VPVAAFSDVAQPAVETVAHAGRFFLALVFVAAGASKLGGREELERAVAKYRLLPGRFSRPVAVWLPRAELAAGLLLGLGGALVPVAWLLAALLLVFSGAVGINLLRGREMSCNCFGASTPEKMTWLTVGRNLVLMSMAVGVALVPPAALALWPGPGTGGVPVGNGEALAMLLAAVSVALVVGLVGSAVRVIRAADDLERRAPSTHGGGQA